MALGLLVHVFPAHDYATVGEATAAYMAARGLTHPFGIGYIDTNDGQYKRLGLKPGEEFDGTQYLPFDEMGNTY